jgi:hypothetical protein
MNGLLRPTRCATAIIQSSRHSSGERAARKHADEVGAAALHCNIVLTESVGFDPNVWSGRAMQEISSTLADAVLHQCIRPLIGACAPGHHGYQRACDLITG